METKIPQIAKAILRKKNKVGYHALWYSNQNSNGIGTKTDIDQ